MRVAFVSSKIGSFGVENRVLKIADKKIPLRLLDMVVITDEVEVNSKNILKLSRASVAVLFISKDSKTFSLTLPQFAKNSDLKQMQFEATAHRVEIAKKIVWLKFESHLLSLNSLDLEMDASGYFRMTESAKSVDELLGVEGMFAKAYFSRYFGLFPRNLTKGYRSKNPPLDPINAMLSFVYTILYHTMTAKLYMEGFEPSISYLHTPFRSHYALSSDLLELHRGEVNNFVAWLFLDRKFGLNDFSDKNGIYLKSESRGRLWSELSPFMKKLEKDIGGTKSWLRKVIKEHSLSGIEALKSA